MKRVVLLVLLFAALPAFAVDVNDDCRPYQQLAALYEIRSAMLRPYSSSYSVDKVIDARVDQMRGPLGDGTYRWIRFVRPTGDAPYDKHGHTVVGANGSSSDAFEASGQHTFAVAVVVPQKKSLFSANNPVYVGKVRVSYTIDGRTRTKEEAINTWMNPDTSRTIDLGGIADRADASLDASTNPKDVKNALVEIHFRNAVPRDDPANPSYESIVALQRLRGADPYTIDNEIARMERALFPEADPIPFVGIVTDLRKANELQRSKKTDDQEKGKKLFEATIRKLQ